MKKKNGIFLIIIIFLVFLLQTGCLGLLFYNLVTIRTENNVSSVLPGGTLGFTATGQEIVWYVSSTKDSSGPVASGTGISADGMLNVAVNETFSTLYVIATSLKTGKSDYKQIRLVTVTGLTINYSDQPAVIGRTFQFRASVTGTNNPDNIVNWRVSSNAAGTGTVTPGTRIDSGGALFVSANETLSTLYIMATSVVDPSISNIASVSVVRPVVTDVVIDSANQTAVAGRPFQLRATVLGLYNPDNAVTWRVSSNAAGTGAVTPGTFINSNGLLSIAANETLSVLYIIANSVIDPSIYGSVSVFVVRPSVTSVIVSPPNQSVIRGRSLQFNALVIGTNSPNSAVTWRVSSNAVGSGAVTSGTVIHSNGLLIVAANETAMTLYVFAISVQDTSKSGSVSVNILTPAPNPAPDPNPGTVARPVPIPAPNPKPEPVNKPAPSPAPNPAPVNKPAPSPAPNPAPVNKPAPSPAPNPGPVNKPTPIPAPDPNPDPVNLPALTPVPDPNPGAVNLPALTPVPDPNPGTANRPVPNPATDPNHGTTNKSAPNQTPNPGTANRQNPNQTPNPGTSNRQTPDQTPNRGTTNKPTPDPISNPNTEPASSSSPVVTGVDVSPSSQTTQTNKTVQFKASVNGNNNPNNAVSWKVSSTANGTGEVAPRTTINASGLLTVAPNEWSTVLYVIATSVADPSKSGTAIVTIRNNNENQGKNQGR